MQKPFLKGLNSRSSWSDEEDAKLMELVQSLGQRNWALIAQELPGRVGKQCRERWRNHLDPSILHGPFSEEEDAAILKLVAEVGTRWARIAEQMPGRTENSIKNRYYCFLKRKADAAIPRAPKKARVVQETPPTSPVSSDSDVPLSDADKPAKARMLPPVTRSIRTSQAKSFRRKQAKRPTRPQRGLCFAPLTTLNAIPPFFSACEGTLCNDAHQSKDLHNTVQLQQWTAGNNNPLILNESCLWSAAQQLCTLRDA